MHAGRLTGGEPLTRRDIPTLVRLLTRVPGIHEIALSTNGMLLSRLAAPLARAWLARVNVSLDSLDPQTFHRLTRFAELPRVLRGIQAAEEAGLRPIKINTVVIRGINDRELLDLARLTIHRPWHVRFIELVPVGTIDSGGIDLPRPEEGYLSLQEMKRLLEPLGWLPAYGPPGNGPARTFPIPGATGTVGFISATGAHFCATCNRLRLTADGCQRTCLFASHELSLREGLQRGGDLEPLLRRAAALKPEGHPPARAPQFPAPIAL